MPDIFRCPSHGHGKSDFSGEGFTNYLLVTGEGTIYPGEKPLPLDAVVDGASETVILADVNGQSVEWLRPGDLTAEKFCANFQDVDYVSNHPSSNDGDLTVCVFADGLVLSLGAKQVTPEAAKALTTAAGGDAVELEL